MKTPLSFSVLALISIAGAQNTVQPYRTDTGIKSTTISTTKFVPAVRDIKGQLNREVENEFDIPRPAKGEPNTLKLGVMSLAETAISNRTSFPGINETGWVPADPDLAVGPTHAVNVVNVAIGIFKRDGTKVFQQDLGQAGFFQGTATAGFVFDPKCFYDPISKRFFVVGLEQDDTNKISGLLIAVSDDSNPEGNWFRYRVEAKQTVGSSDFWLDYPGFGFSKDAIMLTGNMFGFTGGYNGVQFVTIPKAPMLAGQAITASHFTAPGGSVQVMRPNNDANTPVMYAMNFSADDRARIYAVKNPASASPVMQFTDVAVPTINWPSRGGISVSGHELDSLDGRVMNLQYRGGRLFAAHGIQASASDDRPVARWYEFNLNNWPTNTTTPTYTQGGNVGASGQDFIMPAIAVNGANQVAMIYTRTSSSIVADLVISARKPTDTLGTMSAPTKLAGSTGSTYGGFGNRWGDYFGLQVDPVDDRTFWGVGMVGNSNGGWITRIESFKVADPTSISIASIAKFEGGATTGTVTNVAASDNSYFNVNSVNVARTGQVASVTADFNLNKTLIDMTVEVESKAISGVSGTIFLYDWTKKSYEYFSAGPLGTGDSIIKATLGTNFARFVSPTKQVRVLYRAIYPVRSYGTPAYTLGIDQIKLTGSL